METNIFEKNCRNCMYFERHYKKTAKGFKEEVCGCCTNRELNLYQKRKTIFQIYKACEFWKPIAMQIEERKADILKTLKQMQKSLNELAIILKDDK